MVCLLFPSLEQQVSGKAVSGSACETRWRSTSIGAVLDARADNPPRKRSYQALPPQDDETVIGFQQPKSHHTHTQKKTKREMLLLSAEPCSTGVGAWMSCPGDVS